MREKKWWIVGAGAVVFVAVFALVFSWKSKTPEVNPSLAVAAQRINDLGYLGNHLMACVDNNQCPASYDPQSALGLMPFVKMAEDQAFLELQQTADSSKSLQPVLEGVQDCSKYCSCPVWQRFLESEHGVDFKMDITQGAEEELSCPTWAELAPEDQTEFLNLLKSVEGLQN